MIISDFGMWISDCFEFKFLLTSSGFYSAISSLPIAIVKLSGPQSAIPKVVIIHICFKPYSN